MPRTSRSVFYEPGVAPAMEQALHDQSHPLDGWDDLDPLIERVGDARFVLLGEASHGTAEYYDWRRLISQRLIREKDFSFIAVEGDWPDCYRVNRYVKGYADSGAAAREVLEAFQRWPTWMWANEEVARLMEWLREYNRGLAEERQVGFYGLDVYSLWESMQAVFQFTMDHDRPAAAAVRRALECFEPYGYDAERYAHAMLWAPRSCEDEVVRMLKRLRERLPEFDQDDEARFNAEQNAVVAKNAETYYRTMIGGGAHSWNLRDRHMVETLDRLMARHGRQAKAIVWEHNTHVGDARYTDMVDSDMVNVGQLVRQLHETDDVVLVGFSSYRGSVIAGEEWGAPAEAMSVPPARPGSWEDVLHQLHGNRLMVFEAHQTSGEMLEPRGHRAIGVVYRPQFESYGNYVPTVLPRRYDAMAFIDRTHALHPLPVPGSFEHELPETYPTGV